MFKHVLTVVKEPDYYSGGHFHQGKKPHINPFDIYQFPIGTKLYVKQEGEINSAVILHIYHEVLMLEIQEKIAASELKS